MFDARQRVTEITDKYQPFQFTGLDGQIYQLPHPLMLSERHGRMMAEGDLRGVFTEVAPEALAAIEEMPLAIGAELGQAWVATAGEPGKSPLLFSETNGNGLPSNPISSSEASTSPVSTSA